MGSRAATTTVTGKVCASTASAAMLVVADHVAAAVVWVRNYLVGHVLLTAEELFQTDDRGDHQSDFTDQQSFAGD